MASQAAVQAMQGHEGQTKAGLTTQEAISLQAIGGSEVENLSKIHHLKLGLGFLRSCDHTLMKRSLA